MDHTSDDQPISIPELNEDHDLLEAITDYAGKDALLLQLRDWARQSREGTE